MSERGKSAEDGEEGGGRKREGVSPVLFQSR